MSHIGFAYDMARIKLVRSDHILHFIKTSFSYLHES